MRYPVSALAQCPDGTPPPCGGAPAARAAAPNANSVAVLYFDNLSRDTADTYLADGLSDEIRSRLGQVQRLTVTARTTMQRYRGPAAGDPAALARTLRVAHLVSGTVRRGPGRLRVGVELVRARDGVQLWSETYDRTDGDLLAIEAEVAGAVATAIAGRLLPAERATIAARATRNPAAHDRVLRGNFLMARRTLHDAIRGIREYEAAIALDPDYADAHARVGWAYAILPAWDWQFPGLSLDSVIARSSVAARRALAIDSSSALAWLAMAMALAAPDGLNLAEILVALRRAIALDPRLAEAQHALGTVLLRSENRADGVAALRRAVELEPERPITLTWLGIARLHERNLTESRRWLDSAVAVAPAFGYALAMRAVVRSLQGDAAGARFDADAGLRASPGDTLMPLSMDAFVRAHSGDSAGSRASVRSVLGTGAPVLHENAVWIAGALAQLGDRDGALAVLGRTPPSGFFRYFLGYAILDPLRGDARFQRIVASVQGPR